MKLKLRNREILDDFFSDANPVTVGVFNNALTDTAIQNVIATHNYGGMMLERVELFAQEVSDYKDPIKHLAMLHDLIEDLYFVLGNYRNVK
jgi:hypothetical protein